MPSNTTTAKLVADADTIFTAPKNAKVYITGLEVHHVSGSAITITIQDTFTPSATHGTTTPSSTDVTKKVVYIESGASNMYGWTDETNSIEILDVCKVYADATDTNCYITLTWKLDNNHKERN